ncbi:hypothetical protein TWF694_002659 [Orbilia ellipsospora]|uniref:Uncharacterized protein n=1 Tax=Orbilia ellipsospora TaxID=2528407 RepID=A0AAV9X581_9PEZI
MDNSRGTIPSEAVRIVSVSNGQVLSTRNGKTPPGEKDYLTTYAANLTDSKWIFRRAFPSDKPTVTPEGAVRDAFIIELAPGGKRFMLAILDSENKVVSFPRFGIWVVDTFFGENEDTHM